MSLQYFLFITYVLNYFKLLNYSCKKTTWKIQLCHLLLKSASFLSFLFCTAFFAAYHLRYCVSFTLFSAAITLSLREPWVALNCTVEFPLLVLKRQLSKGHAKLFLYDCPKGG